MKNKHSQSAACKSQTKQQPLTPASLPRELRN